MMLEKSSHAKINLFLNVVGKDDRGYHLLESFFALLKLSDKIVANLSTKKICKTINAEIFEENICYKAIEAVVKKSGSKNGIELEIHKKIPIGAGLGGGSSNAASTIKILNDLWKLNYQKHEMAQIGRTVGADVPFFIYDSSSMVQGTGEIVQPLNLGLKIPILLVNPRIFVSTKEVYKLSVKSFSASLDSFDKDTIINQIYNGKNDLTEAAIQIAPEIGGILDLIKIQSGCINSRMSGTGSTCFGIFKDEDSALVALNKLQNLHPQFWYYYELLEV